MGWNPFRKGARHPMLRLIRDARYAQRTGEIFQANREADAVGMLSERELTKCIKQLRHDPSEYGIPARKIRAQGRHAEQSLQATLADPGFIALTTESQGILDDSPAETALDLLADCGSEHSIPTIQRFLDHPQLGRTALRVFLKHCTPQQFATAVAHADRVGEDARSWMRLGIGNRFYKNDGDDELRTLAAAWLTEHAFNERDRLDYDFAGALCRIAPDKARDFLLSDRVLSSDDYSRKVAYRELARNAIWIDADTARPLVDAESDPEALGSLLHASVRHLRPEDWQPAFDKLLAHAPRMEDRLSRGMFTDTLLDTLAVWLGHDGYADLAALGEPADELTPLQRELNTLELLDIETNNGGPLQYFFNSAGANWAEALETLERIGADQVHAILSEATETIGLAPDDRTRDAIHARLEHLSKKQETKLTDLSSTYYKQSFTMKLRICKYIANHQSELRKLAGTR